MRQLFIQRFIQSFVALFLASIIVFLMSRVTGNPLDVMMPITATQEEFDVMSRHLGLDKPLYIQYAVFLRNAAQGDFGRSIIMRRPVLEVIIDRFPASFQLAFVASFFSLIIGVPLGIVAALKPGRWPDMLAQVIAVTGQSLPLFWVGIVLIQIFGVWLRILPPGGYGGPRYILLPGLSLGWFVVAAFTRLTRSSMLDVLEADYIKLARIKGLSEKLVIWKHALRNALIPVVTYAGILFASFATHAIVIETVFGWPGIGRLSYEAVMGRDYPLIQGLMIVAVMIYLIASLLVDILYAYLDPRIRYENR